MGPGITLYNPNLTNSPTSNITGDLGIITIDASPTIFNNCTFKNLTHAIDAKSSFDLAAFGRGGFNIGKKSSDPQSSYPPNIFDNNKNHLFALGIIGLNAFDNVFKNSSEAIYFYGRSKYNFVYNQLSEFTYGLMSLRVGELTNTINNNKWVSTKNGSIGIDPFSQNQNMNINQNCFNVKLDDWNVFAIGMKSQGTNSKPSVNLFTHNQTSSRDIYDRTTKFDYWHHDPNLIQNLDPHLIPLCARNARASTCVITSNHVNQRSISQIAPSVEINCTLDQNNFPTDQFEETEYDSLDYVMWKTRRNELYNIVDGGNTQDLIDKITNQPDSQSTLIALVAASPYVSNTVLEEVINSAMQSNYKFHILTLNAPIPDEYETALGLEYSSQQVENLLGEYYHSLPALRDTMRAALDEANFYRIESGMSLIKQKMAQLNFSVAENYVNDLGSHELDRLIFSIKLFEHDTSGANDFLDGYSIENTSDQAWVSIARIALRLDTTSHEFVLTNEEDSILEAVSLSYLPEASQASAILYNLKEKLYDISEEIYDEPETIILSNKYVNSKVRKLDNIFIYPNPTANELNVFLRYEDIKVACFRIISCQGTIIRTILVSPKTKNYLLDISDLNQGLYILQLLSERNIKENKIFVKE